MTIKAKGGMVTFITNAGKDFVRSQVNYATAMGIVSRGSVEKSDRFPGFPMEVKTLDGKVYYFPAEEEKTAVKKKEKAK